MKTFISILIFTFFSKSPLGVTLDISEDITAAIKTGVASNVVKYFSANVDMKIIEKEGVYSKAQAELILKDFFTKNPIKSFSIIHKGASKNGEQFAIGIYESISGQKIRSYFLFKKTEGGLAIQQFRFEPQDE